jgi:hypothetical protein
MAVAISQTANPAGAGSGTTITYSGQSIGTADVSRVVVVCVGAELTNGEPTSATIDYGSGAVAMSAGTLGQQGAVAARIFYLPVPTGTTADIAVTFGASQGATTHQIAVYRVVGGVFSAESGVGDTDADPITSGAITIPSSGGAIGVSAMATDTTARTWTGITEDIDADAGTFRFTTGTSTTGGTPTITVSGGNNEDGALSWLIFAPGYTVAIDAGSYSLSGQAVTFSKTWTVGVDAGSYSISGQDVALAYGRSLGIDAGSYAITGQDVSLDFVAGANRAVVTWAEVSFEVGATGYSITIDPGSYSVSGQDVALTHAWLVDVGSGSYSISGQDVALSYGYAVSVEAGSYSISGQTVALEHGWAVSVDAGSYSVAGQAVALVHDWAIPVDAGSYSISGQDVTLTLLNTLQVEVDAGSYAVTGNDVELLHAWLVDVDAGSYEISGQDVTLTLLGALTIDVDAGSYEITGQDVELDLTETAPVEEVAGSSGGGRGRGKQKPRDKFKTQRPEDYEQLAPRRKKKPEAPAAVVAEQPKPPLKPEAASIEEIALGKEFADAMARQAELAGAIVEQLKAEQARLEIEAAKRRADEEAAIALLLLD